MAAGYLSSGSLLMSMSSGMKKLMFIGPCFGFNTWHVAAYNSSYSAHQLSA